VADTARAQPDLDLTGPGFGELELLDRQGFVHGPENRCAHRPILRTPVIESPP
jgi:hypothetical protein